MRCNKDYIRQDHPVENMEHYWCVIKCIVRYYTQEGIGNIVSVFHLGIEKPNHYTPIRSFYKTRTKHISVLFSIAFLSQDSVFVFRVAHFEVLEGLFDTNQISYRYLECEHSYTNISQCSVHTSLYRTIENKQMRIICAGRLLGVKQS